MLLQIQHETTLIYSEPVSETVFEVRMAPPSDEDQTNLGYRLRIHPAPPVTAYRDGFGNRVDLFNLLTPYKELTVRATSIVRTHRRPGEERLSSVAWPVEGLPAIEALEFLQPSPLVNNGQELACLIAGLDVQANCSLWDQVRRVVDVVQSRLKYEKKVTSAQTLVSEALELGRGVCQDFAHVFLGICRGIGLPSRYVSGYVEGPGELATHAWCQVWAGAEVGWVDVDPTRAQIVGEHHAVTAVGRDFSDVPPNRGVWKGLADETIRVAVKVEAIDRMPPDWSDWGVQAPWLNTAWSTTQHQERRLGPPNKLGYRQQQSQQQQSG